MVTATDRLARNTRDLLNILHAVKEAGAGFRSIAEPMVDTTSQFAEVVIAVLGVAASWERQRIVERTSAGRAQAKARGVRHILVRINEVVSEAEARRKLETVRDGIVNGVDFAEQARLYSQDGSAAKGGDLGWLSPGDTVPEFERAMDALKPGEVSQVIQSPFGMHLIQVLERRERDMSEERQRAIARQAIRERKLDEAYQDWLRQLRDRTYVENRLNEQ